MKVIIAGGREFDDAVMLYAAVDHLFSRLPVEADPEIVSGGARGADRMGEEFALERGHTVKRFPADWSQGKAAGPIRNRQMADYADVLIAFWDGYSPGTKNMINTALQCGLEVHVYRYEP